MNTRCRVTVAGSLAAGILATLESRFEVESAEPRADGIEVVVSRVDQATQRALLTYLWDTGHTIRSLGNC